MLNYASFCLQIFVMTPNFCIHIHGFPGHTTQILNSSYPSQAKVLTEGGDLHEVQVNVPPVG